MSKRLKAGQYAVPGQLLADARLMFDNCFTFNPPGDQFHELGRQLQAAFARHWQQAGLHT